MNSAEILSLHSDNDTLCIQIEHINQRIVENIYGNKIHIYEILDCIIRTDVLKKIIGLVSQFENLEIYILNRDVRLSTNIVTPYMFNISEKFFYKLSFDMIVPQQCQNLVGYERDLPPRLKPYSYKFDDLFRVHNLQKYRDNFTFVSFINRDTNLFFRKKFDLFMEKYK